MPNGGKKERYLIKLDDGDYSYQPKYAQSNAQGDLWVLSEDGKELYDCSDGWMQNSRVWEKGGSDLMLTGSVHLTKDGATLLASHYNRYLYSRNLLLWEKVQGLENVKLPFVDARGDYWIVANERIYRRGEAGVWHSRVEWNEGYAPVSAFCIDGQQRLWIVCESHAEVHDLRSNKLIVRQPLPQKTAEARLYVDG